MAGTRTHQRGSGSARGQLNAWGYCTKCLWEHNEADEFSTCYSCREYSREWQRQRRERLNGRSKRRRSARNGNGRWRE